MIMTSTNGTDASQRGLTLLELMVAVVICGVLLLIGATFGGQTINTIATLGTRYDLVQLRAVLRANVDCSSTLRQSSLQPWPASGTPRIAVIRKGGAVLVQGDAAQPATKFSGFAIQAFAAAADGVLDFKTQINCRSQMGPACSTFADGPAWVSVFYEVPFTCR